MESETDSEQLSDWERILSPSSSSVAVKEGFLGESSAFPPRNHEDLTFKLAPEDNNPGGPEVTNLQSSSSGGDGRWSLKRLHIGSVLRGSWITWMGRGVRNKAAFRVGFWSFAGAVAALVLVSWLRRRVMLVWKNLQPNASRESLLALIKDKEKRIHQLLLQIAQLNEVLQARRRVRVLQT